MPDSDSTVVATVPATDKVPKQFAVNAGKGRKKGVPNQVTRDMRRAAHYLVEKHLPEFSLWITRVAVDEPGRACDIFIRLIETYTPKPTQAFEIEAGTAVNPLGQSTVALRLRSLLEGPT